MLPLSIVSRRLIARHRVDLPDPLGRGDVLEDVELAEMLVDVVDDDKGFTAS
jgi:hypothetical protein